MVRASRARWWHARTLVGGAIYAETALLQRFDRVVQYRPLAAADPAAKHIRQLCPPTHRAGETGAATRINNRLSAT